MRATLKDIAQIAGVNESTVSYVINNKPKAKCFQEKTRERILNIARDLNYHPNAAARALSTCKTGNIGFILSDQVEGLWENPYWAQMLTGSGLGAVVRAGFVERGFFAVLHAVLLVVLENSGRLASPGLLAAAGLRAACWQ